jgi:CRISPR-associated endoribonuclease Cas6
MKNEDYRSIIISSPNKNFISFLRNKIRNLDAKIIHFGEMKFDIINLKIFDLELNPPVKFVSATPVIIRIPQSVYKDYNLELKHPYRYIFWRSNFPLELFLNQLELNLKRKYFNYYHEDPQSPLKFNRFVFKKQISQKILIKNMSQTIIATFWEFWIDEINELIRFGLDAGIGERNTLGFGFLNLK